ncbi:MAG: sporulation protein, partial [Bacillaceae bacterium]|nr:sporulation protein [Bacillaceae bacterium]
FGLQVYHRHRFRMEKIQKDLSEEMKKRFPDEKITVSYDFKIFLETSRLIHKIRSGTISGEKAEKEIGRIVRLNNEKT